MSFLRPEKHSESITQSDIVDYALLGGIIHSIFGLFTYYSNARAEKQEQQRLEEQQRYQASVPHPLMIRSLGLDKTLGHEPNGGWEQYHQYLPYFKNVKIMKKYLYRTKKWPAWMLIEPEHPTDFTGEPWNSRFCE